MRGILLYGFILLITFPKLNYAANWGSFENWQFAGNMKLQSSETLLSENDVATLNKRRLQHNHIGSSRLMSNYQNQGFTFDIHYDLKFQYSTMSKIESGAAKSKQIIDLNSSLLEKDDYLISHRIDRLMVGYTQDQWVFRVGRQAISWGNGFLFNPMDLFNPFSQTTIDKDYKSGEDMIYLQWLFDSGNDWQWVFIPRKSSENNDIDFDVSSAAFKYKYFMDFAEMDFLAARHYDENILGIGIIKSIKESMWRLDATITRLQDESLALMLVTNVDYSWIWLDHNMYSYVEYFYNSMGKNSYQELLDSTVLDRVQRSEIFTVGSQYVATGLSIETSPLTSLSPSLILNLNDNSMLIPVNFTYSWKQNTTVTLGGNFVIGKRDTEFGGFQIPGGRYLSQGQSVYFQIANYF